MAWMPSRFGTSPRHERIRTIAGRLLEMEIRHMVRRNPFARRLTRSHATEWRLPGLRAAVAIWLLALAVVLLTRPAHAAGTYYVDASSANCSNSGAGTQANPYCSISAAAAARGGAGTTLIVMPG